MRLTCAGDPAPDGNVRDGDFVANDVAGFCLGEMSVEGAVETTGLVSVAVDAVLNLLRSVACICQYSTMEWMSENIRLKWLA